MLKRGNEAVTLADLSAALQCVQPSAMREVAIEVPNVSVCETELLMLTIHFSLQCIICAQIMPDFNVDPWLHVCVR